NSTGDLYDCSTCSNRNNCYQTSSSVLKAYSDGCRIDYIMYKFRKNLIVQCKEYRVCLSKIGDTNIQSSLDFQTALRNANLAPKYYESTRYQLAP
ncbi:unnamed protein product, partial [Brachionus calyciflorus]